MAVCGIEGCTFGSDPHIAYEKAHEVTMRHYERHKVEELMRIGDVLTQILEKVNLTNEAPETILRVAGEVLPPTIRLSDNGAGAPGSSPTQTGSTRPGMCGECGFHMMSVQHRAHITGVAEEVK